MSVWLDSSGNSNKFKQSYFRDFVDVSGEVLIRNGLSLKLYNSNVPTRVQFSINSNEFRVYNDADHTYYDISNTKLMYLQDLSENVQAKLNQVNALQSALSLKANASDVDASFVSVTGAISTKASSSVVDASFASVTSAIATKASTTVVDASFASVTSAIATKASTTVVDASFTSVTSAIATKASTSIVDASFTSVTSAIATKASTSIVDASFASVTSAIATKATTTIVDASFASVTSAIATKATTTIVDASFASVNSAIALKANLASPTLTGVPTAPTATAGTNTTQLATTAFVKSAVDNLVASAPAALDTLNELAAALGNDAAFSTTVTNSIASKAPLANPTFTGTVTASKVAISSDASFSGRVDVCGNFYANYPANSIPQNAIVGGISSSAIVDLTTSQTISGVKTFSTQLNIGTNTLTPLAILAVSQMGSNLLGRAAVVQAGASVALNDAGTIIAIGCPNDYMYGNYSGSVRVYQWSGSAWSQLGADIMGTRENNTLGYSVSLSSSGLILAIGGPSISTTRIYQYVSNAWSQLGADIVGTGQSGSSVSISADGMTVAIGAPHASVGGQDSGQTRVYKYISSAWTQLGQDIASEAAGDWSGYSVALSADGTTVVIGANYNMGANGYMSGHARIYKYASSTWTQIGQDLDGEVSYDMSGWSVAISDDGTIVAIGAPRNTTGATTYNGQVRVYKYANSTWTQIGQDIDGRAIWAQSGTTVSLSADGYTVAIGADSATGLGGEANQGYATLYKYDGTIWKQLGTYLEGSAANDKFGTSVALSADGSTLAAGAPFANSNDGYVKVYKIQNASSKIIVSNGFDICGNLYAQYPASSIPLTAISANLATLSYVDSSFNAKASLAAPTFTGTVVSSGDVSLNSKLRVSGDASFNGRVDICGNFYAKYPASSIPVSAIAASLATVAAVDTSLNLKASIAAPTFTGTVVSSGDLSLNSKLRVSGDASFNGRVDICGNFYAKYPASSIPASAIVGVSDTLSVTNINISGNVGIGTTTPQAPLQVVGNSKIGSLSLTTISAQTGLVYDASWSQVGNTIQGMWWDLSGTLYASYCGWVTALNGDGTIMAHGSNSNYVNIYKYRTITLAEWNLVSTTNRTMPVAKHPETVYDSTKKYWVQMGNSIIDIVGIDDGYAAVSLNEAGDTIVIGGVSDDTGGSNMGTCKVFKYDAVAGAWNQVGQNIYGSVANEYFGGVVDINAAGNIIAAGGQNFNSYAGRAVVYRYDSAANQWNQIGQTFTGGKVGASLSLSSDGYTIAIAHTDTMIARIYTYSEGTNLFVQNGGSIVSEVANDRNASSVSLNADGTMVAVGASWATSQAGQARVYEYRFATAEEWAEVSTTLRSGVVVKNGDTTLNATKKYWVQIGNDVNGNGGRTGIGVSLRKHSVHGTTLAVMSTGSVKLFKYRQVTQSEWNASTTATYSSGLMKGNDTVYSSTKSYWIQLGYDRAISAAGGISTSLDLNSDGTVLAFGSPLSTNYLNKAVAGLLYVYSTPYVATNYQNDSIIDTLDNNARRNLILNNTLSIDPSGVTTIAGRIDICGNLYAKYPDASIPASAINGVSSNVQTALNLKSDITYVDASLNLKANLVSPTFTGPFVVASGDVSMNNNLSLGGDLIVKGNLSVFRQETNSIINTTINNYEIIITKDISLNGNLAIANNASLNSKLFVADDVSLNNKLFVNSNATLNSKLSVANDASFNGRVDICGNLYAQYPDSSIPASAITDGVTRSYVDASLNVKPSFSQVDASLNLKSDITYVDASLNLKSDITYVDASLNLKSNITYVDSSLNLKSDITYVDASLNLKSNLTYVDASLNLKSNITYVDASLNLKSDITYVDASLNLKSDITYVDASLNVKPSFSQVDASLNLKSNLTYVDASLNLKSNLTYVDASLNLKSNLTYVDASLNLKSSITYVDASLNLKSSLAYVDSSLNMKSSLAYVDSSLNMKSDITYVDASLNMKSDVTYVDASLNLKANLASPTFTGTPNAPTASYDNSSNQLATTGFVQGRISSIINSAPAALDTLNELAAALGNDANYAASVTNLLSQKANITDVSNALALKSDITYVDASLNLKSNLAYVDASLNVKPSFSQVDSSLNLKSNITYVDASLNVKPSFSQVDASLNLKSNITYVDASLNLKSNITYVDASLNVKPSFSQVDASLNLKSNLAYVDASLNVKPSFSQVDASLNLKSNLAYVDASLNVKPSFSQVDASLNLKSDITYVDTALNLKANLASPTFTGTPNAPTAAYDNSSNQLATTGFVQGRINSIINSAPAALDTLNELAAALGNDSNYAASVTNSLSQKANITDVSNALALKSNITYVDASLNVKPSFSQVDASLNLKSNITYVDASLNLKSNLAYVDASLNVKPSFSQVDASLNLKSNVTYVDASLNVKPSFSQVDASLNLKSNITYVDASLNLKSSLTYVDASLNVKPSFSQVDASLNLKSNLAYVDSSLNVKPSFSQVDASLNLKSNLTYVDASLNLKSAVAYVDSSLNLKANLASPTFTGTPNAPTASYDNSSNQLATTGFVQGRISSIINSAPAALDTLNELAAALGNDANYAATVTNSLSQKANITDVSNALALKSNITYVDASLNIKPSFSQVDASLNLKSNLAYVDASLNVKPSFSQVDASLNLKSNLAYVDASLNVKPSFSQVDASLNLKSNITYVDASLNLKSSLTYVDASLNVKPSFSQVDSSLNLKSNVTYVDASLNLKSSLTYVDSSLNLKSSLTYVDASLNVKPSFSQVDASLNFKANLASPTFTGTPNAPTATYDNSSNQIATTGFVQGRINSIINSAPAALDTLNELAAALGNDANYAATVTNSLSQKANTTDVNTALALKANISSVDASLNLKSNLAYVDASLNVKPSFSQVDASLNLKSNVTYVDASLNVKPSFSQVDASLNLKSNLTYVDASLNLKSSLTYVDASLNVKPSFSQVDASLNLKSSITYVDASLNLKSNVTYVDASLNLKSSIAYVDASLNVKPSFSQVDASLNLKSNVTYVDASLNLKSAVTYVDASLNLKANLASPTFTGTPNAPTATYDNSSNQIATTGFVQGRISSIINSAPAALDTLNELAAALGNDANYAATVTNSLSQKANTTDVNAALALKANITSVDASLNLKSNLTYVDASLNAKPSFSQVDVSLNAKPSFSQVDVSLNAKPSFSQVDVSLNAKPSFSQVDASLNLKSNVTYVDASLNLKSNLTYVDASLNVKPSFSQVDASLNLKSNVTYVDSSLNLKSSITYVDASLNLKSNLASPTFTGTPNAPTAAYDNSSNQIATTGFVQGRISAIINSAPAALDTLNELAAALGNDANYAATVTNSLSQKANTTDVNSALALKATISSVDASLNLKSNLTYVDASLNAKPSFLQVDASLNLKSAVTYVDASLNLKSNLTYVDASLNAKPSFSQVDASLNLKSNLTYVDASLNAKPSFSQVDASLNLKSAVTYVDASLNLKSSITYVDASLNLKSAVTYVDASLNAKPSFSQVDASLNLKSAVTYVDASLNAKPSFSQVDASLNSKANLASPTFTGTPNAPTALYDNSSNQIATTGFVQGRISSIINSAPAALDTLNELAAALGNDANYAATVTNSLSQKANTTDVNTALALKATISSVDASLNAKPSFSQVDVSLNLKSNVIYVDASLNLKSNLTYVDASLNLKSNITYVDASLNAKPSFSQVDASLNAKPSFSQVDASLNLKSTVTYVDASLNLKPSFSQVDASLNLKPSFSQADVSLNLKANLASPTFTGTPNAPTASYDNSSNQIATTGFVQGRISSIINSAPAALDTLNELAAALGNDANYAATVTNSLSQKANTTDVNTALALRATISSVDASLNLKSNLTYVDASLNAKPSFSQVDVSLNAKPSFSQVDVSLNAKPSFSQVDVSLNAKPSFAQVDVSLNLKSNLTYVDASLNMKSNLTYVDASLNAKPSFAQVDVSLNAKPSFSQVDASLNLKSNVTYVDASLNLKSAVTYVDASLNLKPSFSQADASLNLKANLASPTFTGTPNAPTASYDNSSNQIATTGFVQGRISSIINSAPAALDTLNELAAALGNDANYAATVTNSLSQKANTTDVNTALALKATISSVDASLNLKSNVTYVDASLNAKPSFSQVDVSLNAKPSFSQVDASLNLKSAVTYVDASLNLKAAVTYVDASLNLKAAVTYVDASLNAKPSFSQVDVSLNAKPSFSQVDVSLNAKPSFSQVDASLNLKSAVTYVDASLNAKPSFAQVDVSLNTKPSFSQVDASLNLKASSASPTFTGTLTAPKLISGDASFNGNIDISGVLSVTQTVNSVVKNTTINNYNVSVTNDLSLNGKLIVSSDVSLNSKLYVKSDASFNGRVDVCGNFYAQYPNNSIPSSAINNGVTLSYVDSSLNAKPSFAQVDASLNLKTNVTYVDASLNAKPSFSQVDASLNFKPSFSQVDASLNLKPSFAQVDASLNLKPSFSQVDASLNLKSNVTYVDASLNAKPSFSQIDASLNLKSAVTYVDASLNLKPSFAQVDVSLNAKPSFSQVDASLNLKSAVTYVDASLNLKPSFSQVDVSLNLKSAVTYVDASLNLKANLASPTFTGTPNAPTASYDNSSNQIATTGFVQGRISSIINSAPAALDTLNELAAALGNDANFAATVTNSLSQKANTTDVNTALALKANVSSVDASLNLKPSFSQVDASLNLKPSFSQVDASLNLKPSFSQVDASLNLKSAVTYVDASLNLKPSFSQVDASLNLKPSFAQVDASLNAIINSSQIDASLNLKSNITYVDASLNLKSAVTYVDASLNLKSAVTYVDASLNLKSAVTYVDASLNLKPSFSQVDASLNLKSAVTYVDASLNLKANLESPTFTGTPNAPTALYDNSSNQIATTGFVQGRISSIINSAPAALDTLNELAAALGNDANYAATVTNSLSQKANTTDVNSALALKPSFSQVDASLNLKSAVTYVDASLNLKPSFSQVDVSLNLKPSFSQVDASLNLKSSVTYVDASLNLKPSFSQVDVSLNLKPNFSQVDASLNLKSSVTYVDASLNLKPSFSQVDASLNLKPSFSQVDASLNLKPTFAQVDASLNAIINMSQVDASLNLKPSFSQVDSSLNLKPSFSQVDASLNLKSDVAYVDASLNLKANLASPTFTGTPNAPTASYDNSSNQIATTGFVQGRISSIINSAPAALDTLNELAAALGNDANYAATITNSLSQKANTTDVNSALALKPSFAQVDASLNMKPSFSQIDASLNLKPSFSQVDASLNLMSSVTYVDASLNLKPSFSQVDASLNLKPTFAQVDASLNAIVNMSQVDASLNLKPNFSQVDASLNLKPNFSQVDASLNLKPNFSQVDASLNLKPNFSQVDASLNLKPSFSQVDVSLNLKANVASPTFAGVVTAAKLTSGDASFNGNVDISGVLSVTQTVNSVVKNTTINNYNVAVTNDLSLNGKLIVSSDASLNSKLYVKGDASFNGRVDICGNFYANYPANSIPSSAIIGGGSTGSVDISSNQTISGVKTFTNGIDINNTSLRSVIGVFDPSFQRVQIGQDIDGEAAGDQSGFSVSINSDGTIVAIGAPQNSGAGINAGHVRVYKNINGTWTQLGQDINGEAASDRSGHSVSLSSDGTIVAIGGRMNAGTSGTERGHVRVYKYNGSTWTKLGQDIDGEANYDESGRSVSISSDGTIVAIGAIQNDGFGNDSGHVRVYQYNGSTTWTQLGQDINGEAPSDRSGWSVSLSSDGTIVAVGAPYNDGTSGTDRGSVRIYKYDGSTTWTKLGQDIDGEGDDESGSSVSLSSDGTIVAIGAPKNDGIGGVNSPNSGHVRVYKYNGSTTWTQLGQDIDGEAENNLSGCSVSLSSDGTILAIGAYNYALSNVVPARGHARIYQYSGTTWTQLGSNINGEAVSDQCGWAVSISSDSKFVAVGGPFNDNGSGTDSGHVRVYQIRNASLSKLTVNNNVDICGNFYAQYPAASIPASAINGISTTIQSAIDLKATKTIVDASFTSVNSAIALKANLASPALTGVPTAPTATAGTNTTQLATTAFVTTAVSTKADLASPALTGVPTAPTATAGTNTTQLATTAFVTTAVSTKADLASPALTGVPTAPTATAGTNTTQLATTAFTTSALSTKANLANPTFTGTVTASKVTISSDASFNGRVDICGNFYAQYPASSIPSSAIIGGVGGSNGSVDISSNQTISGVKTFTNGLNVGNTLVSSVAAAVTFDPSFQRVKIGQDIDGEAADDQSGFAVSLSADGTIVAIGARFNDGTTINAGQVRVYKNISGTWTKLGQDIDGEDTPDQSGYSVSLSADGTIVAIGAIYNDGGGADSGHVRVYKYNGSTTWTQLGQDINGEAATDWSGYSVSLSSDGTIVAIGSWYNNGVNGSDSGHVRIYQYNNGSTTWTKLGQDIDGEAANDQSGFSVSLSSNGQIVAIGARYNAGTVAASYRGQVRVYQYNGTTTWTQIGQDIDGEASQDNSGWSVSLSSDGTIVAIGAVNNDGTTGTSTDNRGSIRVYKNISGTWTQLGQDIDGEAAGDLSGFSISLNGDGTIVAIGAYLNDGTGSNAGHVRIYQYISNTWQQLGSDVDGEAAGDQSGYSVSLSSDGTMLAVGANTNDGVNGVDSGHVRVYQIRSAIASSTKLTIGNNVDICGNFYAQYAAASIPASAINGISSAIQTAIDLKATKTIVDASFTSVNSAIALKADLASPTFTGNVVASKMRVTSDASFNGRVDICGNFYAQYPASSIPSSAIIGGVGGGSSINLAADISVNGVTVGRGPGDSNFSTVLGLSALGRNTGGYMNVAVGCTTLFSNLTGNQNVAMNFSALYSNTSGSDNIAIGKQAITTNQTGNNNVGIGSLAIQGITSSNNTAVGHRSLVYSSTGSSNTAFGYLAGQNNSTGSFNTYIGYGADLPAYGATWSNSTAIGANAMITASNQITLGTAAERVFMPGKLTTSGDASFNGRVDISGSLYANYPANSIPQSAIIGGVGGGSSVVDLTTSQTITGTKTFSNQINIGSNSLIPLATLAVAQLGTNLLGRLPSLSGSATALNDAGTIVAVGSPGDSNYRGAVRMYQWSGTAWTQLGQDILSATDGTQMGISVSLNSTGLILAAGGLNRVRIYQYANSAWSQLGADIINAGGNPVSISSDGTTVALGNPGAYINGGENTGRTIIFKYINSTWTQLGQDLLGEAAQNYSGTSLSLSADGTIVVIGANYNDGAGPNGLIRYMCGHARIYKYANSTWTQLGQDIDGENNYDMSGWSVDISDDGTVVAIGAPRNFGTATYTGQVRVYKYANSTWTKLGQDIDGRAEWVQSGTTVALSADGYTVAVGAGYANGLGGEASRGYAVVYKYNGTTWSMVGSYIEGQTAGDQFGFSIALSSDGTILSAGSPYNNSNAGNVRVYKIQTASSKIIVSDGVDICGNLYAKQLQLSSNATFNGRVDISGNLYANSLQLTSSATFNGRVDICGNFYAQYPPNSIPASAIIGGVGSSSGSSGSSTGANVTFTDNFALIKEAVVVDPAATLLRQF